MLHSGPDNPRKLSLPVGDLDSQLLHGFLDPRKSAAQTAFRSVQPFLHSSTQTTLCATSVAIGRIYATHAMRPKIHLTSSYLCRDDRQSGF